MRSFLRHIPPAVWVMIAAVALLHGAIIATTVPLGDDIGYSDGFALYTGGNSLLWPRWALRHIWFVNGRIANLIAPWVLALPRWLQGALCAVAMGAVMTLTLSLASVASRRAAPVAAAVCVAFAFIFPWADAFWLVDVSLNYVWATAAALLAVSLILKGGDTRLGCWGVALSAFAAGMFHEGCGVALACGAVAWIWLSPTPHRSLPRATRVGVYALIIGAAAAFLAPGLLRRLVAVSTVTVPDDPWWLLILKSCFIVIPLMLLTLYGAVANRERLRHLMRTPWALWTIAAVVGTAEVAVGGIVGRSGWFAQTFAIIAICLWFEPEISRLQPGRPTQIAVWALAGITLLILADSLRWQVCTSSQLRRAVRLYEASPDGVVYINATDDSALPFWVLRRTRGVPDGDDVYIESMLAQYHRADSARFVALPLSFRDVDIDSLAAARGVVVSAEGWRLQAIPEPAPQGWISIEFVSRGHRLYLVRPLDRDWGDR